VEQEKSGVSIRAYCKQLDLPEHAFYWWRQKLRTEKAVSFALIETKQTSRDAAMIDLALAKGDRLRIPSDEATLRLVVSLLREQKWFIFRASVRVYLCTAPCDMRRSFDGLSALVTNAMQLDTLAGHSFVFSKSQARSRGDSVLGCVTKASEGLRSCTEDGRRPPGANFQE
jgi:transposase-like protein